MVIYTHKGIKSTSFMDTLTVEETTTIQKLLDVIAAILADEYIQALRKQGESK